MSAWSILDNKKNVLNSTIQCGNNFLRRLKFLERKIIIKVDTNIYQAYLVHSSLNKVNTVLSTNYYVTRELICVFQMLNIHMEMHRPVRMTTVQMDRTGGRKQQARDLWKLPNFAEGSTDEIKYLFYHPWWIYIITT